MVLNDTGMRILVLSKRQYMNKDLLDDRYGRLYELPKVLAERGHEVQVFLLSYRQKNEEIVSLPGTQRVLWRSVNSGPLLVFGLTRYFKALSEVLDKFQPDIVLASSDALHAVIAWRFCQPLSIPFVIDLYDNYESFGLTQIPGVTTLLRRACRNADGLTLIGHELDKFVAENYQSSCPRKIIGNAVPENIFRTIDKIHARQELRLPTLARLIGTAGAITQSRGIDVLFDAFMRLAETDPNLWLVFAGARDKTPKRYCHARIIDLGELEQRQVPLLINALDVAVICNLDTKFGRYCFPQKFYEIVSCKTPLVAAKVGEMARLLAASPQNLYSVKSVESLMTSIRVQLDNPVIFDSIDAPTWNDLAEFLETFLFSVRNVNRAVT